MTKWIVKRVVDVVFSLIAFVVLFPLLVSVALAIRCVLGKPIFFSQKRVGLNGKTFKIFKFRTMRHTVGKDGQQLSDVFRHTKLGNTLRSWSIDELPQLWNVLKGEMSLVGPRPLLEEYLQEYSSEQMRRHDVRPGITGWAQVNGRNDISWDEKFELDVWYVDNHSLLLDASILRSTIVKVASKDSSINSGNVLVKPFRKSHDEN